MKKLLLIWPYFPPDPGAAAARGAAMSKYLADTFEVKVLTRNNAKFANYVDPKYVNRLNLHNTLSPVKFIADCIKLYRSIKNGAPDSIIVSAPSFVLMGEVALIAALLNIAFIVDLRDLNFLKDGLKGFFLKWGQDIAYKRAKQIWVTTEIQSRMLELEFPITKSKTLVVPNGVDLGSFSISANSNRSIDIVHIGSLNPERDTTKMADFFAQVLKIKPNTVIKVVGFDKKSVSAREFIAKLSAFGIIDRIEIIEEIPHQEVFAIVKNSKIGLITLANVARIAYQMPVKVLEYLAGGTAVAALVPDPNSAVADFFKEYRPGVMAKEVAALASEVVELLGNESNLKMIRDNNLITIQQYDRAKIVRKVTNSIIK